MRELCGKKFGNFDSNGIPGIGIWIIFQKKLQDSYICVVSMYVCVCVVCMYVL